MDALLESDSDDRCALFLAARSGNKDTFQAVMEAVQKLDPKVRMEQLHSEGAMHISMKFFGARWTYVQKLALVLL